MKSPIKLYSDVLGAIGASVDSQGLISQSFVGSDPTPVDIDGRRLVLPTPEVLAALDNSKMIAFHPICENITMGNSPVIEKFRRMVQTSLALRISTMAYILLDAVVNVPKDKELTGTILGFATHIPEASPKTLVALEKVLQAMNGEDRTILRIYLKRQAELGGTKYRRAAQVYFPIMDEFADNKPQDHIYDVKMTKRDKATLRQLFNILIPNIEVYDAYSVGSNSTVAPNFDALIRVTHKLCSEIGSRAYQYRKYLDVTQYRTDMIWGDEELNLSEYANFIPTLDGNDGVVASNQTHTGVPVNNPAVPQVAQPSAAVAGAYNLNNGIATAQNPGVSTAAAAPTTSPFRGLGSAPPANGLGTSTVNNATRLAQQPQPVQNPSIFAHPPQVSAPMGIPGMMPGMPGMGMPGMVPGMTMPPMGIPGMMPGMPAMGMPGMMPGVGINPQVAMLPGMMPPVQQGQMQQPQMVQQPMMMPGMGMPAMGMMQPGMVQQGYPQQQAGAGLFKRV